MSSNSGFSTIHIGQFNAGDTNDYRGHIQDFRVTIGSNRGYTGTGTGSANFTLPGSVVESSTTFASRSPVGLSAINNAQVDTAQSQFGGASLKVDGVDDALQALFDNTFDASGDFCIEMWARGSGYGSRGKIFATYPHHSSLAASIFVDISGGSTIRCYIDGGNRVTTGTWSNTTWTHIALQRTGTKFELFVGGTRAMDYTQSTPKDYSMDNSASFHLGGTFRNNLQ